MKHAKKSLTFFTALMICPLWLHSLNAESIFQKTPDLVQNSFLSANLLLSSKVNSNQAVFIEGMWSHSTKKGVIGTVFRVRLNEHFDYVGLHFSIPFILEPKQENPEPNQEKSLFEKISIGVHGRFDLLEAACSVNIDHQNSLAKTYQLQTDFRFSLPWIEGLSLGIHNQSLLNAERNQRSSDFIIGMKVTPIIELQWIKSIEMVDQEHTFPIKHFFPWRLQCSITYHIGRKIQAQMTRKGMTAFRQSIQHNHLTQRFAFLRETMTREEKYIDFTPNETRFDQIDQEEFIYFYGASSASSTETSSSFESSSFQDSD